MAQKGKAKAASDAQVIVRQTRSDIGRTERFRATLRALGLGRIGAERQLPLTPAVKGMLRTVETVIEVRAA